MAYFQGANCEFQQPLRHPGTEIRRCQALPGNLRTSAWAWCGTCELLGIKTCDFFEMWNSIPPTVFP